MSVSKYLFWIGLVIILGYFIYSYFSKAAPRIAQTKNEAINDKTNNLLDEIDTSFIKSVFELDTNNISSNDSLIQQGEDQSAGINQNNYAGYNRINIALIGLDGRMGSPKGHADANHVVSLIPDAGIIEIISIPRDTYVDCGYDDTTNLNKLTTYYLVAGRRAYLRKVSELTRIGTINYYVEFGFSQALGLFRLFGYNAGEVFQVLRSRKSFPIGDYQRVYNQGQFIRQMILKHFDLINGTLKPVFINGILALVETNMKYDDIAEIFDIIAEKEIHKESDKIIVKVRPGIPTKYKVFDFTNPETIAHLKEQLRLEKIAQRDTTAFRPKDFQAYLRKKLDNLLTSAEKDTSKNPKLVINKIRPFYDQKIWLQINDDYESLRYSRRFSNLLINSYLKIKDTINANMVSKSFTAEEELFNKTKVR